MEPEKLRDRFKQVRIAQGLSQTALATKLGVTPSYVSAMERGDKNITRQTLERLIELFEVSADWLISGISANSNSQAEVPISLKPKYQSDENGRLGAKKGQNKTFKFATTSTPADLEKLTTQYHQALSELEEREWRNIDRRLRTVISHLMLVQELTEELVGTRFDDKAWTALRDASSPPRIQYKKNGQFVNPLNEMSYEEKSRYYAERAEILERCEAEFDDRFRDLHISLSRPGRINPDAPKGTVAALLKGFFEKRYKDTYGEDWDE